MKLSGPLHWLLITAFALAASCARQTTPTGGPKDSIPPNLISSVPTQEQVKFGAQRVELTFDEAIQLSSPKEQIIITPNVGKDFEATVKKNQVVVTFDKPLLDNTTYAISFRESIQDITEKNPAQNLRLAFSTGDYIDSLSISGFVYELLLSKESKDATVALYQSDTFNIFQHKPSYITKTDAKGIFQIANLKPGAYYIYAWMDNNRNLIVDSKSEAYGYRANQISLSENQKNIEIPLVRLDARPLKLTSARSSGTFYNIKTSKGLKHFRIKAPDHTIYASYGTDQENVRIYNDQSITDSLLVAFTASDSILNKVDTALYVKFSKREIKPEAFEVANNAFTLSGATGILQGSIRTNKPLAHINFDSTYYKIDSAHIIQFTQADLTIDSIQNIITFRKTVDKTLLVKKPIDIPQKKASDTAVKAAPPAIKEKLKKTPKPVIEHQLYFGKAAFLSIEGDSSKSVATQLKPTTLESTGMIHTELKTKETNFIVQLLFKDKVVASRSNILKVTFEDLEPGDYKIRVITDTNKDGQWTPGNFFSRIEPERIVYYKNDKATQIVSLKANWELGPLLITF